MKRLVLLLAPAALIAGQARYARLAEAEGKVEVQIDPAAPWQAALRNVVLPESAWIRTEAGARAEIEFDDGGVLRLGPDSLAELSDYTRLSTGQGVTLLSLDRGLAYFTGAAGARDSLVLAVPGAQVTIRRGSRLRLEAREASSLIAIIEGAARVSCPAAELDLKEGRTIRVEPANSARFYLFNEVSSLPADSWSEERDKVLAAAASGAHVSGPRQGLADLDAAGTWVETAEYGTVWKPKMPAGWAPFRLGKWMWYDDIGYTWVSADPWGWLPYHYGRWMLHENAGWIWAPGRDAVFSPGDVYWLRGAGLTAWGPLAPEEQWTPPSRPRLYYGVAMTYAALVADAREIDPAGFAAPKQPPAMGFVAAPPSPPLTAARMEAKRPVLRAGSTRIAPQLEGVAYDDRPPAAAERPPEPPLVQASQPPAAVQPPEPVIVAVPQPAPPVEIYYPVPVPAGVVVMNPPERPRERRREEPKPQPKPEPQPEPKPKPEPAPTLKAIDRSEQARPQPARAAEPAKPAEPDKPAEAEKPVPRKVDETGTGTRNRRNQ
ncbi:MAG: DUF6600 domain-containing protein [Bryobacteraceae bacterium]